MSITCNWTIYNCFVSKEKSYIVFCSDLKVHAEFDIFVELSIRCPLHINGCSHFPLGNMEKYGMGQDAYAPKTSCTRASSFITHRIATSLVS